MWKLKSDQTTDEEQKVLWRIRSETRHVNAREMRERAHKLLEELS